MVCGAAVACDKAPVPPLHERGASGLLWGLNWLLAPSHLPGVLVCPRVSLHVSAAVPGAGGCLRVDCHGSELAHPLPDNDTLKVAFLFCLFLSFRCVTYPLRFLGAQVPACPFLY